MENLIAIVVIVLIVGSAIAYIVREKKKGVTCIGCPAAGNCGHKCSCGTSDKGCSCDKEL